MRSKLCATLGAVIVSMGLIGCSIQSGVEAEKENIPFVVVSEECLPEELLELITSEKETIFKLTYADEDYLYICRGYGKQETGGYSVTVEEFYRQNQAIYLRTNLLGPSKEDQKNKAPSYPYIVLRIDLTEENVVFDS